MNNLDFDAIEVANGQEALDACELGMPEMILLDWHMPVMGGMEFLQSFRPVFKKKRPYILFCATENDKMEMARAITMGANDYVLKPYDREVAEGEDPRSRFDVERSGARALAQRHQA